MKKIKKNPLGELTAVTVVVAVVFDGVVVVVVEVDRVYSDKCRKKSTTTHVIC